MAIRFTTRQISQKYDRFARWYDIIEGIPDLLGVRKLRQQLLERASGGVLEVAVGTGKNLHYYPDARRITAVDVSKKMLNVARERALKIPVHVLFLVGDAEALPFSDHSFDTVVSSLSACTFSEPVAALQEMARVCRSDGKILLLEHGRSNREWLGRWQVRRAERFAERLGCHWNREPVQLVTQAGLKLRSSRRKFFGVFHEIEAQPS